MDMLLVRTHQDDSAPAAHVFNRRAASVFQHGRRSDRRRNNQRRRNNLEDLPRKCRHDLHPVHGWKTNMAQTSIHHPAYDPLNKAPNSTRMQADGRNTMLGGNIGPSRAESKTSGVRLMLRYAIQSTAGTMPRVSNLTSIWPA